MHVFGQQEEACAENKQAGGSARFEPSTLAKTNANVVLHRAANDISSIIHNEFNFLVATSQIQYQVLQRAKILFLIVVHIRYVLARI